MYVARNVCFVRELNSCTDIVVYRPFRVARILLDFIDYHLPAAMDLPIQLQVYRSSFTLIIMVLYAFIGQN